MESRLLGYKVIGNQDFVSLNIRKDRMNSDVSFGRRILSVFEENDIRPVHMSVGVDAMTVYADQEQFKEKANIIMDKFKKYHIDSISEESDIAIIKILRTGEEAKREDIAKVFLALHQADVEPKMINQSGNAPEIVIGVKNTDYSRAVEEIYHTFEIM